MRQKSNSEDERCPVCGGRGEEQTLDDISWFECAACREIWEGGIVELFEPLKHWRVCDDARPKRTEEISL